MLHLQIAEIWKLSMWIYQIQNSNQKPKQVEIITAIDESEEYMSIRFVPKY